MPDTLAYNLFVDQPFQTTVRDRVTLDGIGLHSGRFVELSICPAPANTGIKFRRIDIDAKLQTVAAHAKYAERARLCTRIVNIDGIGLETIEHMMAAFAGVGLDNVVVEINAPEAPITPAWWRWRRSARNTSIAICTHSNSRAISFRLSLPLLAHLPRLHVMLHARTTRCTSLVRWCRLQMMSAPA